jgi:hypothetical protein
VSTTQRRRDVCASCETEIEYRPVFRLEETYCCIGCAGGGPCMCLYEQDLADDGVDHLGLPFPMPERSPVPVNDRFDELVRGRR